MDKYYALMIDAAGTIRAITQIASADDVAAISAAMGALERAPHYVAAEVWRGRERVGKVMSPRAMTREHWATRA